MSNGDTRAFVEWFKAYRQTLPAGQTVIARAPGRLDVMGGIADYSGSLVLQMPLAEATHCAAVKLETPELIAISVDSRDEARQATVSIKDLAALDYAGAKVLFHERNEVWAAYILGVVLVLMRERGLKLDHGLMLAVRSDVPEGKGVSSSAALEVATMRAVTELLDLELKPEELARLCQIVENHVVGAPCGIMDQMASACGQAGQLLALHCQPAKIEGYRAIPGGAAVWGVDSGVRHAVGGSDYGAVRCGAFMGYRIIADLAGLKVTPEGEGRVKVEDPLYHGYLTNIPPSVFRTTYEAQLPETIGGAAFLKRYGGITDRVTCVDPKKTYAVRQPALHPVMEDHRVRLFAHLLDRGSDERTLRLLGEIMYQSHASYSACGLGSDGTDRLVEMVREAGYSRGLYGAKITGGGSGGTVAVLGKDDAGAAVREIADRYVKATGRGGVKVFEGSSPGACASGVIRIS